MVKRAKAAKPKAAAQQAAPGERVVSVLVRDAAGRLAVALDRETITCGDDFTGVDTLVEEQKDAGARAVIVLLADDSVSRHWTEPKG